MSVKSPVTAPEEDADERGKAAGRGRAGTSSARRTTAEQDGSTVKKGTPVYLGEGRLADEAPPDRITAVLSAHEDQQAGSKEFDGLGEAKARGNSREQAVMVTQCAADDSSETRAKGSFGPKKKEHNVRVDGATHKAAARAPAFEKGDEPLPEAVEGEEGGKEPIRPSPDARASRHPSDDQEDEEAGASFSPSEEAIITAIYETFNVGQSWYASTMELQLASSRLCIACRKVVTIHLTIDTDTPRRLLADVEPDPDAPKERTSDKGPSTPRTSGGWASLWGRSSPSHGGDRRQKRPNRFRVKATRIPRIRVSVLTWNLSSAVELSAPIGAVDEANVLVFGDRFNDNVEDIVWPGRLTDIIFGYNFNQAIDKVQWPASLQQLTFGFYFNHSLGKVKWPGPLQQVTFGSRFNQTLDKALWPESMRYLTLGSRFRQPLDHVGIWMPNLEELTVPTYHFRSVTILDWPKDLKKLTLIGGLTLDGAVFPRTLNVVHVESYL